MNTEASKSQQVVGMLLYFFATIFLVGILYTYFGQDHLKQFTSDYISRRIKPAVDKSAAIAEIALLSPKTSKYLTPEQIQALNEEIARYNEDPHLYIKEVTATQNAREIDGKHFSQVLKTKPDLSLLAEKIIGWKTAIHNHFNRVYKNIVTDLRIFCFTNIVAFVVSGFLFSRARSWSLKDIVPATLLTCAVVYSSWCYIDQNWFFNLLLDSFMGVWYPIIVVLTFGEFFCRYKRHESTIAKITESLSRNKKANDSTVSTDQTK